MTIQQCAAALSTFTIIQTSHWPTPQTRVKKQIQMGSSLYRQTVSFINISCTTSTQSSMTFVKSLWICFMRVLESRRDGFNINWLYYYLFLQSNAFSHTSSANVMGLDLYLLSWSVCSMLLQNISALDANSRENTTYAVIGWHVRLLNPMPVSVV